MPGYEPFLLCDFHVHTRWSDGRLSLREVVDLYGQTGRFDVIAITDHILMKRDLLARAARHGDARAARLLGHRGAVRRLPGRHRRRGRARAHELYDLLVIPGAEITQNHIRSKKNSHIVALNIKRVHQRRSAGRGHPARDPRAGRAEHRVPPASPDDEAHRDRHVLPVGSPQAACRAGRRLGSGQPRRSVFGDEPEALSRTWRTATSTSRSISTRGRRCCECEKNWEAIARALRANVDVALTLYRNGSWAA